MTNKEFFQPVKHHNTKDGWSEGWNPACDSSLLVENVSGETKIHTNSKQTISLPKETVAINVTTESPISAEYLETLSKGRLMAMYRSLATVGNGYWYHEDTKRKSRISRETMVSMCRATLNDIGVGWQAFKPRKE